MITMAQLPIATNPSRENRLKSNSALLISNLADPLPLVQAPSGEPSNPHETFNAPSSCSRTSVGQIVFGILVILLAATQIGVAQWPRDPREAIELPGMFNVNLTTDSLGGVFFDGWAASSDAKTYALWFDRNGETHWNDWIDVTPLTGIAHSAHVALCSEPGELIIAHEAYWYSDDTTQDARIQKINRDGELLWPDSGIAVSPISFRLEDGGVLEGQVYFGFIVIFGMVSDDEGGVILAFFVERFDWLYNLSERQIYVQRISADGELLWGNDGVPVVERNERILTQEGIVSDGNGGAVIKYLIDANSGLFGAQKIDRNGERLWGDEGAVHDVGYSSAIGDMASDERGGVIVSGLLSNQGRRKIGLFRYNDQGEQVWGENEGIVIRDEPWQAGLSDHQIVQASDSVWFVSWKASDDYQRRNLIQAINLEGRTGWDEPGFQVSEGDSFQNSLYGVKSFGSGIYFWGDGRDSLGARETTRAQRIDVEGNRLWGQNDVLLHVDRRGTRVTEVESDGSGGAFVYMWLDIGYLQYINAEGELGVPLAVSNPGEPLHPSQLAFRIFPNPVNGSAMIFFDAESYFPRTLSVHNLQGRLIQVNPILPRQRQVLLNLSQLPSGSYLINISTAGQIETQSLQILK